MGDPAFPEDAGQSWVVDVVKTSFDVQKKGGHLQTRPLQGLHVIYEAEAGIIRAQPGEAATLVRVNQAFRMGCKEEACCNYPFQDFRDHPEEDNNPEGRE